MKLISFRLIAIAASLSVAGAVNAQKIAGKLVMAKGQKLEVVNVVKTSTSFEAMGQKMESGGDISTTVHYEATDVTPAGISISEKAVRMVTTMSAMGQDMAYDSDKKEDRDGRLGDVFNSMVGNAYEYSIDANGKILSVKTAPKKAEADPQANQIAMMMGGALRMDEPKTGGNSFWAVLPNKDIQVGDTWVDTSNADGTKRSTTYTLKEIKGMDAIITVSGTTSIETTNDTPNGQVVVSMKVTNKGEIVMDIKSGLVKSKTIMNEGSGTAEVQGMSIPITTNTTITSTVK